MDKESLLTLCRTASVKAKQASSLLHVLGPNMPVIDEEDMNILILLAAELASESEFNASYAEALICKHKA